MECKKCGVDLSGREHKSVAQWSFCPECFQALMEKAGAKEDELVEAPAPEPVRKKRTCMVCEREIERGEGREMLGLVFCLQCHENLIKRPYIPPPAESGDMEAVINPMEKPAVEQVSMDFTSSVHCYDCGREIPAISSKQCNGGHYCPDCYYKLPDRETSKPTAFPAVASDYQAPEEQKDADAREQGGMKCQACRRQVLSENLKTVEGFEICLACLTTDPDTALFIARIRHRKTLERLKAELAG